MIHHADDWLTVYGGDARDVLAELPDASVHCVVTSPPYWGLRDYGTDGQLGLEATPEEYVDNLVAVFREVRRVLRDDGTVWLNLGDSYASSTKSDERTPEERSRSSTLGPKGNGLGGGNAAHRAVSFGTHRVDPGLKPKDLVGIPWRVAFALQADGWWLRSDIIWSKPNPMPESVTDRPTKAHEYLFLLAKRERYYFDQEAVREARDPKQIEWREKYGDTIAEWGERRENGVADSPRRGGNDGLARQANLPNRNLRSVWTIATRPYPGAHFAVFPPELPERCIKAGTSERGVCPECGAPWERVTNRVQTTRQGPTASGWRETGRRRDMTSVSRLGEKSSITNGWIPSCNHQAGEAVDREATGGRYGQDSPNHTVVPSPAVVLDPFAGSGTVGLVANRLSRRAILIDLNTAYLEQQMKRNAQVPLGV